VPDVIVCADKGQRGICTWTQTEEVFRLSGEEWDEYRLNRFSLSPFGLGEYQKFIEKTCEKHEGFCTEGEREQLKKISEKLGVMLPIKE